MYVIRFTILLLCLLSLSVQAWAANITGMRVSRSATRVRVVLDADAPVRYKENLKDDKLELEVEGTVLKAQEQKLSDNVVKKISLKKDDGNEGKLVIELARQSQHRVLVLKNPDRLVIDLYRIQIIKKTEEIGDGLKYTYWQDDMEGLQVRLHVLEISKRGEYYVRPFSGAGERNGRGKLRQAAANVGAKAAVNACYFDTDGWVIGNCAWNGVMYGVDADNVRSALVIDKRLEAQVQQDLRYVGSLRLPHGRTLNIRGVNRGRIAGDLVLYNHNYGPSTQTNAYGMEVRIKDDHVVEISAKGNMRLDNSSVVLSGHGANAALLKTLRVGDAVELRQTFGTLSADNARLVLGGGPTLLYNGDVRIRTREENIAPDIARGRAPRTAIGVKRNGDLVILVADGRSRDSAGMTLLELAKYLRRFGAMDALNLDGGGSSEMVVNGRIVNVPSDGAERPVSIGLGVFRR